jgi:hypothetical protein
VESIPSCWPVSVKRLINATLRPSNTSIVDIVNTTMVHPGYSEALYPGCMGECCCISHGNDMLSVKSEAVQFTKGKTLGQI